MIGTSSGKTIMATNKVLGRTTAGTGAIEELNVTGGASLSGGALDVHARSHAVTSTSDHTANNWKVFYSDGSGQINELSLGSANTVLTSNGTTSAPTFATPAGGVTSVTATAPLTSSGGATPDISTSIATNRIVGRSTAGTGVMEQLTPVGITVSAGNITGIGGTVGTVDNAVPRADGTGGYTVQGSDIVIDDAGPTLFSVTGVNSTDYLTAPGNTFVLNQQVFFASKTGGSGVNLGTNYFVRDVGGAGAGTFRLAYVFNSGVVVDLGSDITAGTIYAGNNNVAIVNAHSETNSSLVLLPKGNGGIFAAKPDGTPTGGNLRGANSVDLQKSRTTAAQVASGANSFIGGGSSNTASNDRAVVCGGFGNVASGGSGGALGAVICGGDSNTASGQGTFVGGGRNHIASQFAAVVCGGADNQATARGAFVGAGEQNIASGAGAVIAGGSAFPLPGSSASADFSAILGGAHAFANRYGMQAHASGRFGSSSTNNGDAQRARFVLRCKTTTNAAVEMALDGGTTYLTIPSGKVMFMNIKVVGSKSDGTAVATYERQYAVKNVAGTSSEVYAPITIGTDNAAGTTIEVATVDAGDYVRIRPTGIASETWRWVASVDAVEVAYGT